MATVLTSMESKICLLYTSTITATATDGSGVTASCEVTVNINYPVQGIALNHDAKTFTKAGETLQLTATIYPDSATNKTVTWKSSDKTVATVDESGLVTAVGNGTANITATTEDGNYTATDVYKRQDLIQEGMLGLWKAVRDYVPDRGASFKTFAQTCVKNSMLTAVKTAARCV